MQKDILKRRSFLKLGLGSTIGISTTKLLAANNCLQTPAQTSGPFPPRHAMDNVFGNANPGAKNPVNDLNTDLTRIEGKRGIAKGQVVFIKGKILTPNCTPMSNASVHLWQADNRGHYNHMNDNSTGSADELDPYFQYSAMTHTDAKGEFLFKTILPKFYGIGGGNKRTAHLHFLIKKIGMETLITQTYFEGDELEDINIIRELNKKDIILSNGRDIRPEFKPLIVNYEYSPIFDAPLGKIEFNMKELGS